MSKASLLFIKLAQKDGSKFHFYGPTHPQARRIRNEFRNLGTPVSAQYPVATDTSATGITLMGYRGLNRGFGVDVARAKKFGGKTYVDTMAYSKAKKYVTRVADKRGLSLHSMEGYFRD